ncbi:MAG TPA: response regulator [Anaeromyxobacteraceae bacterium]|nr:response regulator [Anaeromyxobacteraceae bacterium]
MKILVCCESAIVRGRLQLELEAVGHGVVSGKDAHALAADAEVAGALLVEPSSAKQTLALLRDRGFAGRTLLLGDGSGDELARQVNELEVEGSLALSPPAGLARRFAAAMGGRRRVLIVDDSEIAARLLGAELDQAGFDITCVHDAESATGLILKRTTRPDLILLDINMPKVSGPQFCRFIKGNDRFRSIKVVFCSGENRERVAALAAECGADGYILKDEFLGKWIVENT